MSGHPLSIPHDRKTGVLSEKALQGTSTYRATRWQAKALQTHRPAMGEDCAELPFLCRACVRPYTAQIRPHCLVSLQTDSLRKCPRNSLCCKQLHAALGTQF